MLKPLPLLTLLMVATLAVGCSRRETYTWRDQEGPAFTASAQPRKGHFKYVRILLDDGSAPLQVQASSRSLGERADFVVEPGASFQSKGPIQIHRMVFDGEGQGSMITRY